MRGARPHPSGAPKAKTSGAVHYPCDGMQAKAPTVVGRLVGLAIAMDRPILIGAPGR